MQGKIGVKTEQSQGSMWPRSQGAHLPTRSRGGPEGARTSRLLLAPSGSRCPGHAVFTAPSTCTC